MRDYRCVISDSCTLNVSAQSYLRASVFCDSGCIETALIYFRQLMAGMQENVKAGPWTGFACWAACPEIVESDATGIPLKADMATDRQWDQM